MNDMVFESSDPVLQEDLESIARFDLDWSLLSGKTVFVTGATGLIGSQMVRALLSVDRIHKLGIKVIGLSRSKEKAERVFGDLLKRPGLSIKQGDVTGELKIDEKLDFIIHLASQTASKEFVTHPVETIDTALWGTKNILELAKKHESSAVVYASSMEMYGNPGPQENRTTENELGYIDNLKVRSCYPEAKRMCENMCICYASDYGVPVKIARLAQTFGAGISKNEGRVFAQFARSAIERKDIVLHTAGRSYGNYCYTADAITGILTILLKGNQAEAYNVVNEACTMRIAEMAELVSDRLAEGKIKTVFDIPEDSNKFGYAADVELRLSGRKLMDLGWSPKIAPDLTTMYKRLIKSFQSNS